MDEITSQFCRCERRVAVGSFRCPACGTPFAGRAVPQAAATRYHVRWDRDHAELTAEVLGPAGWRPLRLEVPPRPPNGAFAANDAPPDAPIRAAEMALPRPEVAAV